jgi:(+)-pinoresinol hydroxylase
MKSIVLISILAAAAAAPKPLSPTAQVSGKAVFDHWCATCHGSGPRMPGTAALAAKYGSDLPAELTKRTDLTPDVVQLFVRKGVSVMPSFRKTEITDRELAALGAYLGPKSKKKK